jgi:hypothetical protein
MAENKKGFILYCDLIHTVEQLPDNKAGELFKHILRYVNDLNPKTEDLITNITFEPIKQQLKRDLNKWQDKSLKRSEAGRLGGLKSGEARKANASFIEANEANASNVKQNEQVTDTVTVTDIVKEKEIKKGKINKFIPPTLEDCVSYFFEKGYTEQSAKKFYDYYSCENWKDSKGNAVKSWKQKAQSVWFKDENKIPISFQQVKQQPVSNVIRF